jgi:hypothetical protein
LYGSNNNASGNIIYDNGVIGGSLHGGLLLAAQFGGLASHNTVSGNTIFRQDGAEVNQYYGIRVSNTSYADWATGQAKVNGSFVVHSNNLYDAKSAGTTGGTPPTHSSGTVSDGGVDWLYIGTFENTNARPDMNRIGVNNIYNHTGGNTKEFGVASNYFEEPTSSSKFIRAAEWSSGLAVKSGGFVFYNHSDGVARHYKAKNAGSTGVTPPTHTSGSTSDGVITWLYVGESEWFQSSTTNESQFFNKSPIYVQALDSVSEASSTQIFSGTFFPEGQVSASNGSLYLRNNSTLGIQIYIKTGTNGSDTGWQTLAYKLTGTTGNRPSAQVGMEYFDTTLGYPVWWNGSAWIDATGATP